jgi:hypothetical protein
MRREYEKKQVYEDASLKNRQAKTGNGANLRANEFSIFNQEGYAVKQRKSGGGAIITAQMPNLPYPRGMIPQNNDLESLQNQLSTNMFDSHYNLNEQII